MSVAVPIIESWDGVNRRIYLKEGVSDIYPIEDIYAEYLNIRRTDESMRIWEPLIKAEGNVNKGLGSFTPRYIVLLTNTSGVQTKIIPYNESLLIRQLGDIITDNPDVDSELYDLTQMTVPKPIYIQPPGAEVLRMDVASIEYAAFQNGVWYDPINGYEESEAKYNAQYPGKNIITARSIAQTRGLKELNILSDCNLDSGTDFTGFKIKGHSHINTDVIVDDDFVSTDCVFIELHLSGILDGGNEISKCIVEDLYYVQGHIHTSGIIGDIELAGNNKSVIENCFTIDPYNYAIIKMGWTGNDLAMPGYKGIVKIMNFNSFDNNYCGIGLSEGLVILDSNTVISGIVHVIGIGDIEDENGNHIHTGIWNGGVIVINETINKITIGESVRNVQLDELQAGSLGMAIYETNIQTINNVTSETVNGETIITLWLNEEMTSIYKMFNLGTVDNPKRINLEIG